MIARLLAVPEARHVRLVASLPRLPRPFDPRLAPASAIRMARRLEALTPHERARLAVIEDGFVRARLAGLDDDAVVARARAAVSAAPGPVSAALGAIWQVRGAEALALARAGGATGPVGPVMALPGIGPVAARIRRNWRLADFGLGGPAGAAAAAIAAAGGDLSGALARWRQGLLREDAILRSAAFPPAFGFAAAVLHMLGWHLAVEARSASEAGARAMLEAAVAAAAAPAEALIREAAA